MTEPDTEKSDLRIEAAKRRKAAFENDQAAVWLTVAVMARAHDLGLGDGPKTVSLYHPMGTEMDTGPLLRALERAGHRIVLPVVTAKATPLTFRRWSSGDPLQSGGFGTSIPVDGAAEMDPDVLFVPLLAYDDAGYRLGYGGGFYDRTLEKLKAAGTPVAVGIAFADQRVDSVPTGPHDECLDWIATERGLMRAGEGSA